MKKVFFLLILIFLISFALIKIPLTNAEDNQCEISRVQSACGGANATGSGCSDLLKQCQASIGKALQDSINATTPLQSQLDDLSLQIKNIKNTLFNIETSLVEKKKGIELGYKKLAKQKDILDRTIRDYYIKSYKNSPFVLLLSSRNAFEFTQILGYQRAAANKDKAIIETVAVSIQGLQTESANLKKQEANLNTLKGTLDQQSAQLDKIVSGAKAYQSNLNNQLATLNSIQENILRAKLAGLNIPLYAGSGGACSSDLTNGKDPGFSPRFGFFTYGVPNRVGLNQYGAFGRAKAGKSYEDILRTYYNFDSIESRSAQINVQGYSSYSLDDYVKRIYEVPDSWGDQGGMEALKAQAIAARSYALAYTNNGSGSICTTEQCQVFKPDPKGGNWERAVNDTSGKVMVLGGNAIKAWFSSTHGGYIHSSGDIGWSDTSHTKNGQDASGNINNFSDLQNNAYDKDSPWFYCDWGARSQYNGTAWLKPDEVADIVNALMLAQKDSSTVNHLYQLDKPNLAGTDTWDQAKVKQELRNRGGNPYNSVSGISVSVDFGSGKTTNVSVSGDGGSNNFSASDFKNYFNLRAPATIQIVGPLYNVEHR